MMSPVLLSRAAACLTGLALLPAVASAQKAQGPAPTPSTIAIPAASESVPVEVRLLSIVTFWRSQNRPALALQAMRRLLSLEPRDADFLVEILLEATEAAVQTDEADAARAYRDRIASFVPEGDARLARADAGLRYLTLDTNLIREARGLFEAGLPEESLGKYRELIADGEMPTILAPEYYSVLAASSPEGYEEAIEAMEKRVEAAPRDLALQLSYAQVLILREGRGRNIGLGKLQELSQVPVAAERARQLWRQALLWSGPSRLLRDQMEAYLADNPSDPELEAKQEELRQNIQDRGADMKLRGFTALAAQDLRGAEREFQAALIFNPEDAEAMLLIGVVRMQQQRLPEGIALIDRAIAMAPAREEDFLDQLGWSPGTLVRLRAEEDLRVGRLAAAEAKWAAAREAHPDDADLLANFAAYRLRQGKTDEARALLNRAIALAPDQREEFQRLGGFSYGGTGGGPGPLSPAWQALRRNDLDAADLAARRVLAQGTADAAEAETLLGQVALRREELTQAETRFRAALARRPKLPAALDGLHETLLAQGRYADAEAVERLPEFRGRPTAHAAQAQALRDSAQQADDPTRALELLQEAGRLDPANVWVRLDTARLLKRMGRRDDARRTAGEIAAKGEPDALYAAALLASEDDREDDAVALLERIPPRGRSQDAGRLLDRAGLVQQVRQSERQLRTTPTPEARDRLLSIAGRPDPSGEAASEVMQAFARLQDPDAALAAARMAEAANPQAGPAGKIRLASALLGAGHRADAEAMLRTVSGDPALTVEDRRQLAAVNAGLAVASAMQLTEAGDLAAAYRQLGRARDLSPDRTGMESAMAVVHVAAGRLDEAETAVRGMLARDPDSFNGRALNLDIAIARQDWSRAEQILLGLQQLRPNDPRTAMAEAKLARRRGHELRLLNALQTAERQRAAQGASPRDPTGRQIADELVLARDAAASRASVGAGWRVRGGDGGRSRLNEFTLPAEASTILPGYGGRVTTRLEAVALGAGRLGGDSYSLRGVGTNALLSSSTLARQNRRDDWAVGGSLSLAYARGDVRVQVGDSPFGFRRVNAVGAVEYAPLLAENLRLRLTAERLAVNDSVLSYAGLRDPNGGRSFGSVVRSGVRGQLEFTQGLAMAYLGGGYATLDGSGVAANTRREGNIGVAYGLIRSPRQELNIGLDVRYQGYSRNLSLFSYGHGGYFSPEMSLTAMLGMDWRRQFGDLDVRLGGSVGWQRYRQAAADVFPHNAALQGALELAAAGDPSILTRIGASSGNVVVGAARAGVEYALTEKWRLAANARYVRAATYYEAAGLFQAQYRLNP